MTFDFRRSPRTAVAASRAGALAGAFLLAALVALPCVTLAQQPITRDEAIRTALSRSSRVTAIAADTLAAAARLRSARAYPNPSLAGGYSKATPQQHVSLDIPLDLPIVRGPRVRAAQAAHNSARFHFLANRAAIELEVDTLYTAAQGASLRAVLSRATAADAAELLRSTKIRRDAGDASDLDVNLAEVSAAQAANTAAVDSLASVDVLLELQTAAGLRGDTATVSLRDSLTVPAATEAARAGPVAALAALAASAPRVSAASAALTSAQQTLSLQRRSVFGAPAIQIGAEGRDPTGSERGVLPTFGIVLPLPLFNRNQGEISAARAEVTRAEAELATARLDASAQLARAFRTRTAAEARISRDRAILDAATRNASLSARAFGAGEMAIADVLEARRAQRDAQAQYVGDLVAANVGAAIVRVLTTNGVAP